MHYIENKTFDELQVGDTADVTHTLRRQDIALLAALSGNAGPADIGDQLAEPAVFRKVVADGIWGAALVAAALGTELPGPGTIGREQALRFQRPIGPGESVTVRLTVREKIADGNRLILACEGFGRAGEVVITGQVEVIAPTEKVRRPRVLMPEMHLHERGARYRLLIEAAQKQPPIRTAVVHPCDEISVSSALDAAADRLIVPVLVGPEAKIRKAAANAGRDLHGIELIDTPHSHAAAERAVALARERRVEALMKGALHTDELLGAMVKADSGLRTERRMSHVFAFDVPHYPKPLFITDAAINIEPDLATKRDIVQNAIELAHALGIALPRVAILSAVETVNPKVKSTVDAAALCKMADRGQITGGLLDGPLAFDNAISTEAAETKHIVSAVAGKADILVVPDIEAGNMLAKQLIYLAGADSAGIVLGARVPIMLTSRADGVLARLASCALAQLVVHHKAGDTS